MMYLEARPYGFLTTAIRREIPANPSADDLRTVAIQIVQSPSLWNDPLAWFVIYDDGSEVLVSDSPGWSWDKVAARLSGKGDTNA